MATEKAKAIINIERLTVWKREESDGNVTFGDAVSLAKTLMTVSDTPTIVSDDLCGDGEVVDSYYGNMGGTLEYGLIDITSADKALFFGESVQNGTNVVSKNDVGNYVVTAHISKHRDGTVKLTKYMRVLFSPQQEQEQQVTKSGVTWSTKTLNGTYSADDETGVYKYVRKNVDPVTDAALIEKWFTNAAYHGESDNEGV